MGGVRIYIVAPSALAREGLASILGRASFDVEPEIAGADQIAEADEQTLILVECGAGDTAAPDALAALRERFPSSRIVALADPRDLHLLIDCYAAPVDGVVSRNVCGSVLASTLQLVMAGEKVFPTEMLSQLIENGTLEDRRQHGAAPRNGTVPALTERETQILQLLSSGDSNKAIARSLGTAESTVKVHLKNILRKINARNRTQAALWAVEHGIGPQEHEAYSTAAQ